LISTAVPQTHLFAISVIIIAESAKKGTPKNMEMKNE
jgi:hypothetical protein